MRDGSAAPLESGWGNELNEHSRPDDGIALQLRDGGEERVIHLRGRAQVGSGADGVSLSSAARGHGGTLEPTAEGWLFIDSSTHRSQLNTHPLTRGAPVLLRDGDRLQLGGSTVTVLATTGRGHVQSHTSGDGASDAHRILRIGRALDNDVVVDAPGTASYHAEAWASEQGIVVRAVGDATVARDGRQRDHAVLHDASHVEVGAVRIPARDILEGLHGTRGARVTDGAPLALMVGEGLSRAVGRQRTLILNDVDLVVSAGEFVAVAGASGAGKTTLITILNRYRPPTSGRLLLAPEASRPTAIGYVPQEDILHRELPLREALTMSARLRFASGTPLSVIARRCDDLLIQLGLIEHAATRVADLSGGQRKRAAVALELMAEPRLLLLDEPTSGLDPANDHHLMRILRTLADRGYGVVLITHTSSNIALCDSVGFVAAGRLVFWGKPSEALQHFAVVSIDDVYERLEDELTPSEWEQRFRASRSGERMRQQVREEASRIAAASPPAHLREQPAKDVVWQLRGLIRRYATTLMADRRNLAFLLLQVPVILGLTRLLFPSSALLIATPGSAEFAVAGAMRGSADDGVHSLQLIFVLAITLIWLGTLNAARELCREKAIWERERHVGVRLLAYITSKLTVLIALCAVQVLILSLLLVVLWPVPGGARTVAAVAGVSLLAAAASVAMGLMVSATAASSDRAVSLIPLAVIPQLLFAGMIVPLRDIGFAGSHLSTLFIGRWSLEGLAAVTDRSLFLAAPVASQFNVSGGAGVPLLGLAVLLGVFTLLTVGIVAIRGRTPS